MHFSWFRADDEQPGEAQENMMELNLFFRPARLERALDVGAGLGATARWLARRGIAVTSISPDAPLVEYARAAAAADGLAQPIDFQVAKFETFRWSGSFDWVLFQESFQYFDDPGPTLQRAHMALRPGGRLHIGDQFLHVDVPRAQGRFHFLPRVLEAAKALGFELRCLEVLREHAGEWTAAYSAQRPSIGKDIADMLQCGTLEYDAWKQGYLSYQLLAFDKV